MSDNLYQKLWDAANQLLASRHQDGKIDAAAISKFAMVMTEISTVEHVGHNVKIFGDEGFLPRRGCLDCDLWLDPVSLKK